MRAPDRRRGPTVPELLVRTVWRYFITGQSLLGRPTDNASFLYAATADLRGKPVEKLSGPIWHRLARRWAALGVPLLLLGMSVVARVGQEIAAVDPWWTLVSWRDMAIRWWKVGGLAVLGYVSWRGIDLVRNRHTTHEFIYPTWRTVCKVLGVPYHDRDARRNVSLPAGFEPPAAEADEPVEHRWVWRVLGVARLLDRRTDRKLAKVLAQAEAEDATGDVSPPEPHLEEPDIAPSTDLVVRDKPGWPLLADRVRRRTGSSAAKKKVQEEPVRIALPGSCSDEATQKRLRTAVGAVLGMPDPKSNFELGGGSPYVDLWPNRLPPRNVEFADVEKHMLATDLDHPLVGLDPDGKPIYIDYLNNSPHVLVSGGTGTGKSTTIKDIECQRMHWGALLIVVDYKRVSHRWAQKLPGAVYAWKVKDLHNVLVMSGNELERRIENVLPENDDTEIDLVKFPTIDLVIEEANSLIRLLAVYWQNIRGPQDPVPSPAVAAIQKIVQMGREYSMHVMYGAQRASANVFGANGGDVRESFATRILADWTVQTWKMLVGSLPFLRWPRSGGRGIWAVFHGDQVDIVRTPNLTNPEARSFALSGVPCPGTPFSDEPITTVPAVDVPAAAPELVTLSKALEWLPGPKMTIAALRQAAHRGNGFPEPAGEVGPAKTYNLQELTAWKLELDARKGLEESWALPAPRREGRVYRFNVLDPETGGVVCGYVGQTTRPLDKREMEHRFDKPWADLVVGWPQEIWHSDSCTPDELDAAELHLIHTLKPLYNIEGQEGAEHAIPKWTQIEQRQARQAANGLPEWVPVDIFNEPRAAVL